MLKKNLDLVRQPSAT